MNPMDGMATPIGSGGRQSKKRIVLFTLLSLLIITIWIVAQDYIYIHPWLIGYEDKPHLFGYTLGMALSDASALKPFDHLSNKSRFEAGFISEVRFGNITLESFQLWFDSDKLVALGGNFSPDNYIKLRELLVQRFGPSDQEGEVQQANVSLWYFNDSRLQTLQYEDGDGNVNLWFNYVGDYLLDLHKKASQEPTANHYANRLWELHKKASEGLDKENSKE